MSSEEPHEEIVEVLEDEYIHDYHTDVDTTCTICQAEFLDPDDLAIHLQQIHKVSDSQSNLCQFCTQKYTDLINYAEHFRDNHLSNLFYCSHCLRAFTDEDEQRLHEKKHKRGYRDLYYCAQCNENFGTLQNLKIHDLNHHNNNEDGTMIQPFLPYLSAILNVKAENVLVSLRTDTVYICVYCSFSTSSIKHFIKHSIKKQCKTYVCAKCSNVYKKKSNMRQHALKSCNSLSDHKVRCPECNLEFNKFSILQHKRTCKVIKCYTCGTHYNTIYELSEHQSKEHPLSIELRACNFCRKQCVGSVALQKHIDRSHKGELQLYKYMCVYCKTSYKHPQKLFGHFFSKHKDIEPYTCKICSKKFRLRKRFTLHLKLEHDCNGFVEFDENYHVFFTDKKSENPFIPKSIYVEEEKKNEESEDTGNISLLNMNSEMSVTETEGNQTEVETAPKPTLKRKSGRKPRKKETDETITVESSDDESLLVVRKRVQKLMPKVIGNLRKRRKLTSLNKKRFTCNICNKYCYTYQNYNHHISLHSKKDYKKCIKCSKVFRSKEKLNNHIALDHSSSKLTDTLKTMLEKRKKGESYTDSLPMSEKFRRTIKKVKSYEASSTANIKLVENGLSVQKFIENFTPELESKTETVEIENSISVKVVTGMKREPAIKMTKFETKPVSSGTKLAMPVKFKASNMEKTPVSIRLVQPVSLYQDSQNYDNNYDDNDMDRNDSIPEVAEEVMLEGTEETPKQPNIPHKIVIPKLPTAYKDLRIAHLLPEAPFYKIVKVNDVLNGPSSEKGESNKTQISSTIKLPDGKKLVNTNPLAHLLGNASLDKVLEPMKNKYYKSKARNFQGMLAEALSNLDKPAPKKKRKVEPAMSEVSSQLDD